MSPSLRELLTGLIDYAGLFPPAQLPLEQSYRNYQQYRRERDAWMLGRFVCPAARLQELTPFLQGAAEENDPLRIAVLGQTGESEAEFLAKLQADLDSVQAFRARHGNRVIADIYEVRMPGTSRDWAHKERFLALFSRAADIWEGRRCKLYYEVLPGPDWRDRWSAMIRPLADENALGTHAIGWSAGVKLRCGGVEPATFPPADQVAFLIAACRDAGVPLKFTAGLHHAVRHFDSAMQVTMHGFLNLFVAGILAHTRRIPEATIRNVVEDENSADFTFAGDVLRWKELQVNQQEITMIRRNAVTSFGSCSFDEPRADLQAMGIMAPS